MATSGSIDFVATRDNIITEALELLGVIGEGDSPSANQLTSSARTLNMMVKHFQTKGLNLFALQRMYVFLESDKREYSLGASGDHFTTSFVQTALDGAVSSGGTSIVVDSATGISASDNIGIKVDDGTMHWTTVNGAPAGTTITLTTGVDDDAADGAVVYTYTSKANRPMGLVNAVLRDKDTNDIPIFILDRADYVNLTNKTTDGSVLSIYYDPQVTTGKLFVWPETDDTSTYLVLWVQRTLEDFDAAGNDADFPQEWYLALSYNLAKLLLPKYGADKLRAQLILTGAASFLAEAESYDTESYMKFEPDRRG